MANDYPARAADPGFRVFGQAATYTPVLTGTPAAVTVILDIPERTLEHDLLSMTLPSAKAEIRRNELAADPVKGDTLVITGGATYTVGKPEQDRFAYVWFLDLKHASG